MSISNSSPFRADSRAWETTGMHIRGQLIKRYGMCDEVDTLYAQLVTLAQRLGQETIYPALSWLQDIDAALMYGWTPEQILAAEDADVSNMARWPPA